MNRQNHVRGELQHRSARRRPGWATRSTTWVGVLLLAAMSFVICLPQATADTIVLKDGTIVEGEILRESSKYVKIKTKFGEKSYSRRKIEKITKENTSASAVMSIRTVREYDALTDLAQTLKNAAALYDLGRFDEIAPMIEPLLGKGTPTDDSRIKWLLIENYEREGNWTKVDEMLEEMSKSDRESDKIRAKAHMDIFKENPEHNLRKIGGERTKEFMDRELRNKAKVKDSLQDRKIMDAALKEYLDQIVRNNKVSVSAFENELDARETERVLREELSKEDEKSRIRNLKEVLPYLDLLHKTEQSIYRAQAIMPGYATGFELDLVRIEILHLEQVLNNLLGTLSNAYPDNRNFSFGGEDGRLTADQREQWRTACDDFLKLSRPISGLIEYTLSRARPFEDKLGPFVKAWEDTLERVQQMEQNTNRNYDRTRV